MERGGRWLLLAVLLGGGLLGGCRAGYVLKAGYYQLELLSLREPVVRARQTAGLSNEGLRALRTIGETRELATSLGFSTAGIYTSVVPEWERELWNVSACEPLGFEPKRWWFPVVGKLPYLGFFSKEAAQREEAALGLKGWDVHRGRVGGYSTLGWFDDPILPQMLSWPEVALQNLVFHELTHATLWLPGDVQFNESFASFVAEKATLYALASGGDGAGKAHQRAMERFADERRWRRVLWELFLDLKEVYDDQERSDEEKHRAKRALFNELEVRLRAALFYRPEVYLRRARSSPWNNARLMQFRRYNSSYRWFEAVYLRSPGDFSQFFKAIKSIVGNSKRPLEALKRAATPRD